MDSYVYLFLCYAFLFSWLPPETEKIKPRYVEVFARPRTHHNPVRYYLYKRRGERVPG